MRTSSSSHLTPTRAAQENAELLSLSTTVHYIRIVKFIGPDCGVLSTLSMKKIFQIASDLI